MARPNNLRQPKPITHGTQSGYVLHIRRGIPPCEECTEARNKADRLRYRFKNGYVYVPMDAFLKAWFAADDDVRKALDEALGSDVIDAVVDAADQREAHHEPARG